jgi:glutathione S-transferase
MMLIGQYDSPFVRRVGIAMTLYRIPFDHKPWSTFQDADRIRPYNPLTRVPTLVLDDGTTLWESHCIIDFIDGLVPASDRLFPVEEPARHRAIRVSALATGLGDKAVSMFYERRLHAEVSIVWLDRCRAQIEATLEVLERERGASSSRWWFGDRIGHADIALACVSQFVAEAHPGLVDMARYPALAALCELCEAMPVFQQVRQPFIAPA